MAPISRIVLTLCLAAGSFLAAGASNAAEPITEGWYGAGMGGINHMRSADLKGIDQSLQDKLGFAVIGAVGFGFKNNIRVEGEFDYRNNGIKNDRGALGGTVSSEALMANAMYDVNLGWKLFPYVGLGLGFERLQYSDIKFTRSANNISSDSAYNPVFQLIAGLGYKITPKLSAIVDIRFHRDFRYLKPPNYSMKTDNNVDLNAEYRNETALIGLRYKF